MRIIQTVNDTIRLLFNPKTEVFRLSDFLLVRDVDENFLAQVIEVYDDKFDQEANVAKIKLIYRIVNGNEIEPFDNYTPSRECEVAKIKQSEIEKCINLNKKTITLGKNYFSKEEMQINTDFLENNCVIFADKFEQTNQIFENLAPRLAQIKPVLIIDFSGNCRFDNINPYVAGDNFKLPLSSNTIDYIQQKSLIRAKLETQVVLGDIFEEVKKFLETTEDNYIPFTRFIKVVKEQYKKTPSVELLVLISWLKKYSREDIFAKTKREFDGLFKSLIKNKITLLDMSNIKTEWQKEFLEYIINSIQNDVFVLIRLNDNNINNDILNKIYLKKPNISFIPSFAYGYKKASYIMDFAQNYLLMPTLNPKRDFTHANFQIQSLNKEAYLIFGTDTKDFIFTLENEPAVKKKNKDDETDKMFISLNLQLEDMTPLELRPNNFEIKQVEPRKKRLQEEIKLSDVLSVRDDENKIEENLEPEEIEEDVIETEPVEEEAEIVEETPVEEIVQNEEIEPKTDEVAEEEANEEIQEEVEPDNEIEEFFGEDELDYFEPVEEAEENVIEAEIIEEVPVEDVQEEKIQTEEAVEESVQEKQEEIEDHEEAVFEPDNEEDTIVEEASNLPKIKPQDDIEEDIEEPKGELAEFAKAQDEETEKAENNSGEAENTIDSETETQTEEEISQIKNNEEDEIDKEFDSIINELDEEKENSNSIQINENVSIDLNKIKDVEPKEASKLPVFDEGENASEVDSSEFTEGKKVTHEKYGTGEILKVIQYNERCLLQIEFEEVGKRLLDPKIAKLTIVE